MKNLKMTGAVMLATAGLAITTAQADSLLAPLILNSTGQVETFISMRTGSVIAGNNGLHYHWIQKNHPSTGVVNPLDALDGNGGDAISSLFQLDRPCKIVNSFGNATELDMVYQSTRGDANFVSNTIPGVVDTSSGSGFSQDFAGMLVVSIDAAPAKEEGDFLGFAYVVDAVNGTMLDYKMLNNHQTTKSGNFQAGFISKKSIDYSWLPDTLASTLWYSAVTMNDMTEGPEQIGIYDATVKIGSQARVDDKNNQASPQDIQGGLGVFNNDEDFLSGSPDFNVTCLGMYDRSAFIDNSQIGFTANGGWTRRSITPVMPSATNGVKIAAKGAITYKWEKGNATGAIGALLTGQTIPVAWTVETSGNLSKNGTKANRPN